MDIKVEKTESFILSLNRREAEYLKGLVQNPVGENESQEGSDFRHKLFDVLNIKLA